jgi:hypothetical protein
MAARWLVGVALGLFLAGLPGHAQEQLERVVVTGSLIQSGWIRSACGATSRSANARTFVRTSVIISSSAQA